MQLFSSLRRDQKEAVWLLQIGTFLEYFDLMLYVHMAVLLNELFFPKTDPHTAALLTAVAFCSTFVMRPFGALFFGWVGDHIGRKATVVITTLIMAFSCVTMALLPTYARIGIMAAWMVTLCRMLQGASSLGEIVGAELYLTEIIRPPARYPVVALVAVFSVVGTAAALGVAASVTIYDLNWRLAFWIGAIIAIVGTVARTRLRETPDFVDMKRRVQKIIKEAQENGHVRAAELFQKKGPIWREKVNPMTALAYLAIECSWPVCFYFAYMHCGSLLKNSFGYTPDQVILQNFIVSLVQLAGFFVVTFLSYKIYPLKILKAKLAVFSVFVVLCPLLLNFTRTPFEMLLLQSFIVLFASGSMPAVPIFLIHFPVFRRFTYGSIIYALSRSLMYIVTSFGLVYLNELFGHWGLLIVLAPTTLGFAWGIRYFDKLESKWNSGETLKTPSIPSDAVETSTQIAFG